MRPLARNLSADLARALVTLRADDETQARYDELADKNSQGALSPEEAWELGAIVRANTFLGILEAQALATLKPSSPNWWMRRRGNSPDCLHWRRLLLDSNQIE